MRPRISRVLLAAAVLAGLGVVSGCAAVDLTDGWPGMAEPTGWEPKAGMCTNSFDEISLRSAYEPMDCTKTHTYETVHIGQFTGDGAALTTPPPEGHTALGAAWAECDAKTTEYLGGQWRDAKVEIDVSVPSSDNWEGGARWFRCEVAPTRALFGATTSWPKSLKGELAQESTLRIGCYRIPVKIETDWTETGCTESHNGEYVGTYTANDTWTTIRDKANEAEIKRRCLSLTAAYVGVPDDRFMEYRSGWAYWYPGEEQWEAGDHNLRCFAYLDDRNVTRSLKAGGTKALPVN